MFDDAFTITTKPLDKPLSKHIGVEDMTVNEWTMRYIGSAIRGKDMKTRHEFFRNSLTAEEMMILAMMEANA